MRLLIILLFNLNLFASVGIQGDIQKCLDLSNGKLVVPNDAGFPTYNSCPNTNCLTLPEGFSCIYYKISGDVLELDATKKLNYENALKDAEKVKSDFDDAQTLDQIRNYCTYVYNALCGNLPPGDKQKTRDAISIKFGTVKPTLLTRLGL